MAGTRRWLTPGFKARVALEAVRERARAASCTRIRRASEPFSLAYSPIQWAAPHGPGVPGREPVGVVIGLDVGDPPAPRHDIDRDHPPGFPTSDQVEHETAERRRTDQVPRVRIRHRLDEARPGPGGSRSPGSPPPGPGP